jgi:hypothetical protein
MGSSGYWRKEPPYGRIMPELADPIRYSEMFEVLAMDLVDALLLPSFRAFVVL